MVLVVTTSVNPAFNTKMTVDEVTNWHPWARYFSCTRYVIICKSNLHGYISSSGQHIVCELDVSGRGLGNCGDMPWIFPNPYVTTNPITGLGH